jgi:Ca-activated chloride channel homolog
MKFGHLFFLLLLNCSIFAQTKGELSSTRLVNLDIVHVDPLKPPKVELLFRAQEYDTGIPVWDLKSSDIQIFEDSSKCQVISLERISNNRPINIVLVIDHSGSMSFSIPTLEDLYNIIIKDAKFTSPLEHAKKATKVFTSSFDVSKDQIGIVGFGSGVDLNLLPSNDTSLLKVTIDSIKIDGSTAFYDGLMAGIEQLRKKKGINIIVSLTDGAENSSKHTLNKVIEKSIKYNIPIYTIGLGNVQIDTLKYIADTTKGEFFHTNSSTQLIEIYSKISQQIQAYYAVVYQSNTLKKNRGNVQIDFASESVFLQNEANDPEVIKYLDKKKFEEDIKFYGKVAVALVLGVGLISLIYYRRQRKRRKLTVGSEI